MKQITLIGMLILMSLVAYALPLGENFLNYQGILRNATDNSVLNGSFTFNITFVKCSDSSAVYTEKKTVVVESDGVTDYTWGKTTSISKYLFYNDQLCYQIIIDSDTFSVQNFSKVPYAFVSDFANNSDHLGDQLPEFYASASSVPANITEHETDFKHGNTSVEIWSVAGNGTLAPNVAVTGNRTAHETDFKHGNTSVEIWSVAGNGTLAPNVAVTGNRTAHETDFKHGNTTVEIFDVVDNNTFERITDHDADVTTINNNIINNATTDTNETAFVSNMTVINCTGTDKMIGFYINGTIVCDAVIGGGAGGGDKWVDAGTYIYPNSTYADNVIIFGTLEANDWTNTTITESQITDLVHTTDTNASTACSGSEVLIGDGTCIANTNTTAEIQGLFSAGSNLSYSSGSFAVDMANLIIHLNTLFIELTDTFGGDVSGTYDNLLVETTQGLNQNNITVDDDWDIGTFEFRAETFESDVAQGTAPFTIASSTQVANLNASHAGEAYAVTCSNCLGDTEVAADLTIETTSDLLVGDPVFNVSATTGTVKTSGNITISNLGITSNGSCIVLTGSTSKVVIC